MTSNEVTSSPVDLGLTEVPETMLLTLHNRCLEASKENGIISDPKAIEIYKSIDYDYVKSFGPADNSHAVRSLMFDDAILKFWEDHPGGTIVNLGEGLETQRYRLDEKRGDAVFITVDLPSAIEARERFIPADKDNIHVASSALDIDAWAKHVPANKPLFITAQGLFMFLEEDGVKKLFQDIDERFPPSQYHHTSLLFDCISKWLSDKTMKDGWKRTEDYCMPKMPFGVNRFDGPPLFQSWVDGLQVEEVRYRSELMNSSWRYLAPIVEMIPIVRGYIPATNFHVTFRSLVTLAKKVPV